jgi:cytochrome c553
MRKVRMFLLVPLTAFLLAGLNLFQAADDAKPKYTIEEIMEKANKKRDGQPSLLKQVVDGKASDAEKKELLDYYTELAKNKPEKGELADWQKRTKAILSATKDVVDGKPGSEKALQKVVNCKACHEAHKGE